MLHQCFKYCQDGQMRKTVVDTALFTIAEAYFIDVKFYFKSTMMEELRSPPDHLEEGRIDSKSLKGNKSYANEEVSQPARNKGKEKVVENFVDNKLPRKATILRSQYQQEKRVNLFLPRMKRRSTRGLKT